MPPWAAEMILPTLPTAPVTMFKAPPSPGMSLIASATIEGMSLTMPSTRPGSSLMKAMIVSIQPLTTSLTREQTSPTMPTIRPDEPQGGCTSGASNRKRPNQIVEALIDVLYSSLEPVKLAPVALEDEFYEEGV